MRRRCAEPSCGSGIQEEKEDKEEREEQREIWDSFSAAESPSTLLAPTPSQLQPEKAEETPEELPHSVTVLRRHLEDANRSISVLKSRIRRIRAETNEVVDTVNREKEGLCVLCQWWISTLECHFFSITHMVWRLCLLIGVRCFCEGSNGSTAFPGGCLPATADQGDA